MVGYQPNHFLFSSNGAVKLSVVPARGKKNDTFVNEPSWIDSFYEERESDVLSFVTEFLLQCPRGNISSIK